MYNELSKYELLELVRKISNSGYSDEEKLKHDLDLLIYNSNDPEITRYIYSKKYEHLTPEEIVEKALSYKPIITASPPKEK